MEVVSGVVSTTVEGFVITDTGVRVVGAEITTPFGASDVSDANGFFSFVVGTRR